MYLKMLEIRAFEEKVAYFFSRGMVHGTTHLYIGEEATAVGAIADLTRRGHHHQHAPGPRAHHRQGNRPEQMMAELLGKADGILQGQGRLDAHRRPLPGQPGRQRHRRRRHPDRHGRRHHREAARARTGWSSASSATAPSTRATFHESVNLASIWKLPVIYVCENNQYGDVDERPARDEHRRSLPEGHRPTGYRGSGSTGTTSSPCTRRCVTPRSTSKKSGPLLLVARNLPVLGPLEERCEPLPDEGGDRRVEGARPHSPHARAAACRADLFSDEELTGIETQAQTIIDEAVRYAEQCPEPTSDELVTDVYAE